MSYFEYYRYPPYCYEQGFPYDEGRLLPVELQPAPDNDVFTYPNNLNNALKLITGGISDKMEAMIFYNWLMEQASSESDKEIIAGVISDDRGHIELLKLIYSDLTGKMPSITNEEFIPPENYCQGLAKAIMREQNNVKIYRKIYYAMLSRVHQNLGIEIFSDEARHAILFEYLYAKNGCLG